MLPSYTGEEWSNYDLYDLKPEFNVKQEDLGYEEGLDFNFFDFSHGPHLQQDLSTTIDIDDNDRGLFDHLLENVLPLMLPILEANQHGSVKSDVILPALENNKTYLHACLYAAATHARATGTYQSDNVKDDIIGHSWAFVNQIVEALKNDTNHTGDVGSNLGDDYASMLRWPCRRGLRRSSRKFHGTSICNVLPNSSLGSICLTSWRR